MTKATVSTGDGFISEVEIDSGHSVVFDASAKSGGSGEELTSTEGVSASLASCTLMTMQMYAARKEWDLTGTRVEVDTTYENANPSNFKVSIEFPEHLDPDQRKKLLVIAGKCPVHRLLTDPVPLETVAT
ncbi:MAG: OsmC family protein [Solirubrobacterales bacterium]